MQTHNWELYEFLTVKQNIHLQTFDIVTMLIFL